MNKFILVLLLLVLNTYANENWIKLDTEVISNEVKNENDLKMYKLQTSQIGINKSIDFNMKTKNDKTNKKNPDEDLLNILEEIKDVAKKIRPMIKKEK